MTKQKQATLYQKMQELRCFSFYWVGQAWSHCDRCGKPYWEHTHVNISSRKGVQFSKNVIILENVKILVKEGWSR